MLQSITGSIELGVDTVTGQLHVVEVNGSGDVTDIAAIKVIGAGDADLAVLADVLAPMPATGPVYSGRTTLTTLTGAGSHVDFGAACKNIRVKLDGGASPAHIRIGGAATTSHFRLEDSDSYQRAIAGNGVSTIYVLSTGVNGVINVEAW